MNGRQNYNQVMFQPIQAVLYYITCFFLDYYLCESLLKPSMWMTIIRRPCMLSRFQMRHGFSLLPERVVVE